MGVFSKNRGGKNPKMDDLYWKTPYEQMDYLGGFPPIFGNIQMAGEGRILVFFSGGSPEVNILREDAIPRLAR